MATSKNVRGATLAALGPTLAALCVGLLLSAPATAGAGTNTRSIELVRDADARDPDAVGNLRVKTNRKGEIGTLKLRRLEPRTWYAVRDAATGEVLGEVRTNRRGKAKLRIRHRASSGKAGFDVPDEIEVVERDTGNTLLRAATDETDATAPAFGFGEFEGADGHMAWVDLFSYPGEEIESFYLSLSPPFDPDATEDVWYEFSADTMLGDQLPLGAQTVTELAGRAFRIENARGAVIVRGALPDLEQMRNRMPPEFEDPWFPMPEDGFFMDLPAGDDRGMAPSDMPGIAAMFDFDFGRKAGKRGDDAARSGGDTRPGSPLLDDMMWMMPPEWFPFPEPDQERSDLLLRIADEAGDLQDIGNLIRYRLDRPDWNDGWDDGWDDNWIDWIDELPDCPMHDDGATDAARSRGR